MVTNHTAVISSSASNAPNVTRNAEHSGSMASSMSGSSLLVHLCKRFSQFHYQLASDGIHISGRPVSTRPKMHGKVSTEEVSENLPQPSESENASTTPTANGSGSTNTAGEKKEKSKRDQYGVMVVKKICKSLPLHLRTPLHTGEVESLVKFLLKSPSGEYINDILTSSNVDKHRVMQYLNLFIKSGDVIKLSKKGLMYQLNPEKHHVQW